MHLCFIGEYAIGSEKTGGIGTFLANHCVALAKSGHTVSVITSSKERHSGKEEFDFGTGHLSVYTLNNKRKWVLGINAIMNALIISRLLKQINNKKNIDIIETNEAGLAFIEIPTGIKKVIRLHGGHRFFCHTLYQKKSWQKIVKERLSFKKSDAIIAVSHYVLEVTKKYYDLSKRNSAVINYPINTAVFKPAENDNCNNNNLFTVFFAGTLIEKKGVAELINALTILKQQGYAFKAFLCGRDGVSWADQAYRQKLDLLVQENHLVGEVNFMGALPNHELVLLIQQANVCVFPSYSETQGIVVLEAMAVGKPVIFSKLGPGPETIQHEINGLLCDPFSAEDISNQIKWVYCNPEESKKMAANAREAVLDKYDLNLITQKNIQFYQSIL